MSPSNLWVGNWRVKVERSVIDQRPSVTRSIDSQVRLLSDCMQIGRSACVYPVHKRKREDMHGKLMFGAAS